MNIDLLDKGDKKMMEKITDIELYMALSNIKQYCKQQENCNTCAMYDGIECPCCFIWSRDGTAGISV